jgi:hypothetical protein
MRSSPPSSCKWPAHSGFESFEPFHKFDSTVDTLQRRTRKSLSSIVSTENVIEGNLSCLNVSVRPLPAAVAAVSVLAATAGQTSSDDASQPARPLRRAAPLAKSSTNFRLGTVSRINSQRTERAVAWTRALTFWKPKPAQRSACHVAAHHTFAQARLDRRCQWAPSLSGRGRRSARPYRVRPD